MIASIETAKNKSICQKCRKKIEVGDLRGVDRYQSFGHLKQRYFCKDCSKEILEICKVAIEDMLFQLRCIETI